MEPTTPGFNQNPSLTQLAWLGATCALDMTRRFLNTLGCSTVPCACTYTFMPSGYTVRPMNSTSSTKMILRKIFYKHFVVFIRGFLVVSVNLHQLYTCLYHPFMVKLGRNIGMVYYCFTNITSGDLRLPGESGFQWSTYCSSLLQVLALLQAWAGE